MDNLIPFKPKPTYSEGCYISDEEALKNFQKLKDIIQHNIDTLNDPERVEYLLVAMPFYFGGKPELLAYVIGYYAGRLQALLDNLNEVSDSYLGSSLVNELDGAMQIMDAGLLTSIKIWGEKTLTKLVFTYTYGEWDLVELFTNGKSIHVDAVASVRKNLGLTDDEMFQWSEDVQS